MSNLKSRLGALVRRDSTVSGAITAVIVAIVLVANVILYILSGFFGLYLYSPEKVDLELSGATDELFASDIQAGRRVKIIFCQPREDVRNSAFGADVLKTAENFKEKYPEFIEIEYINITVKRKYTDGGSTFGEYVDVDKYCTENADGTKFPVLKTSVIFECENNHKTLTDSVTTDGYAGFYTLDSQYNIVAYNGEEIIASMVKWVLREEHKTVYFSVYHGETVDTGFANMMSASGYNVSLLDLRSKDVPEDAALVVISNPRNDFEKALPGSDVDAEIDRLKEYVDKRGGSVYVSLDPYGKTLGHLETFLFEYGIGVRSAETELGSMREIVRDASGSISSDNLSLVVDFAEGALASKISATVKKYTDGGVALRECGVLTTDSSLGAEALLVARSSAETYAGADKITEGGGYCVAAATPTSEGGGIFVTSGIYLTGTDTLVGGGYSNRDFVYSVMENLFGATELPYGCKTVYYASEKLNDLTMGTARLYTALLMAIPAGIAAFGAVLLTRRKNR